MKSGRNIKNQGFTRIILILFLISISIIIITIVKKGIKLPELSPETNKKSVTENKVSVDTPKEVNNPFFVSKKAERHVNSELVLAKKALTLLVQKDWNPDKKDIPVTYEDLGETELLQIITREQQKTQELSIPKELEPYFITDQAIEEIYIEILTGYNDYISYIKQKGVNQKYTDEIKNKTLPMDMTRIIYTGINDPDSPSTETTPYTKDGEKDYSGVVLTIYAGDVFNNMQKVMDSGILGDKPEDPDKLAEYYKNARNIATRALTYHEMTHVLQRAVISVNAPKEEVAKKSAWMYASKTLYGIDTKYFWKWGNIKYAAPGNNREISQESQANGISFEITAKVFNMSETQKAAYWEYNFGVLEDGQKMLDEIKVTFETKYPSYSPDNFSDLLADILDKYPDTQGRYVLVKTAHKLNNLPGYIGYMRPLLPADSYRFWNTLKD